VAVEVQGSNEDVGAKGPLSENFRQAPLAGAPLQFHLPQPVLGVDETQRDVEIIGGLGENMRNGLAIPHHFDGFRKRGDDERARGRRHRVAQQAVARPGGQSQEEDNHTGRRTSPLQNPLHRFDQHRRF
jgi:hypothetical protein